MNDALLTAMIEGQRSPVSDRTPLFRALIASTLIVPLHEPAASKLPGAATEPVYAVLEREGCRALAGFTDMSALHRFRTGQIPWAPVPVTTLCRVALEWRLDLVVINPAGPIGYEMTRLEFQSLAEGLIPGGDHRMVTSRETAVQIGMPAERPPDTILAAMRAAVAGTGAREVYWFWLAVSGSRPHLGLAVSPPMEKVLAAVGSSVEGIWTASSPGNPVISIVHLDDSEVARTVRARGELLYHCD